MPERRRNVPKIGCSGSSASIATISARPRHRRNAISSSSEVSQPSGEGGRSRTARARLLARPGVGCAEHFVEHVLDQIVLILEELHDVVG